MKQYCIILISQSDVTMPDGEVIISLYDRDKNTAEEFLGLVKIRPPRVLEKIQDNWFRLLPRQWKDKVSGDIHIQLTYKTVDQRSLTPDDFELLKMLGKVIKSLIIREVLEKSYKLERKILIEYTQ